MGEALRRSSVVLGVVFALVAAGACGTADGGGEPVGADGGVAVQPQVTFHKDVAPILQQKCQECHSQGGIAPFSLVTYADTKDLAELVVEKTKSREMPPWGALDTDECKPRLPWKDDLRLSDAELATLEAWRKAGAPEGDAKDAPPPRVSAGGKLPGARDLVPPTTFSATGKTNDVLRCFVMDPAIAATTFVTGTHFVPKNKTIVHHALAFVIPKDAKTPGDATEYDCPGGPNVESASLIAAWAPGGVPSSYPAGVALPLEPGSKIVMQVHYHPHANATPEPDATTFQMTTTDAPPKYVVVPRLLGNFRNPVVQGIGLLPGPADPASGVDFVIPPLAQKHTETMTFTMPAQFNGRTIVPMRILNVGAHMHIVGVDEKITITRAKPEGGEPASECLLHEPRWDFDWQRGYEIDAPVEKLPLISPGDTIQVRCTYDNSMENLRLKAALAEQGKRDPIEVRLGEGTLDEMCLASFAFVRPFTP